MRPRIMLFILLSLLLTAFSYRQYAAQASGNGEKEEKRAEAPQIAKRRAEFLFHRRAFPFKSIPAEAQLSVLKYAEQYRQQKAGGGRVSTGRAGSSTIYIGSGEAGIAPGVGILKSTDGGESWTSLAAKTFLGLGFSKIIADPRHPDTLFASVGFGANGVFTFAINPDTSPSGVYKSTDGGVNWVNVLAGRTIFNIGADLAMHPDNPAILYATISEDGIYKTTDGGASWKKLGGGLPARGIGRMAIAISRSDPSVLYTSIGMPSTGIFTDDLLDIYRSTDSGLTWDIVNRPPNTIYGYICNCSYDNFIEVSPTDANTVYFEGTGLYKSTDGGRNWRDLTRNDIGLHVDFHALAFSATNSNRFYMGNDGGIWSTTDGGGSFANLNTDLSISQFYNISNHPTNASIALGGTQDNGIILYQGEQGWQEVDFGEGYAAIDQSDPNIMYNALISLPGFYTFRRSTQGGKAGSWVDANRGLGGQDEVLPYPPFILHPDNQAVIYYGTNRLWRSTNRGENWRVLSGPLTSGDGFFSAISTIAARAKKIYTGSSDGAVFASTNGGATFRNITGNLPPRYITKIAIDPANPRTVYVALSGFRSGHVFKSVNGGGNWQDISGNLPDLPVNTMAIDGKNSNHIYVGSDVGIFETVDGGKRWSLIEGMPVIQITDISINDRLGLVRVATYGRGIYEMKLAGGPVTAIGPAPIAQGSTVVTRQNISGRVSALAIDPMDDNIIYLGTPQGGVWRSTNGGGNWQPLTDNAPTQVVGAITLAPHSTTETQRSTQR